MEPTRGTESEDLTTLMSMVGDEGRVRCEIYQEWENLRLLRSKDTGARITWLTDESTEVLLTSMEKQKHLPLLK